MSRRFFAVAAALLLSAVGGCTEAGELVFQSREPLLSDLELRVRAPSVLSTLVAADFNEPCDDTAVCVYSRTPPIRVLGTGSTRLEIIVRRDGTTLLDGQTDLFVPEGAELIVTVLEADDELLIEGGAPNRILEGVDGFEVWLYEEIR